MAVETAMQFLERIEREETLRSQLYISSPDNITQFLEWARGKGFIFSENDLADALDDYQEKFPTGTVQPLKDYLKGFQRLPSGEAEE